MTAIFAVLSVVYFAMFVFALWYTNRRVKMAELDAVTTSSKFLSKAGPQQHNRGQVQMYSVMLNALETEMVNLELEGKVDAEAQMFTLPVVCPSSSAKQPVVKDMRMTSYGFMALKRTPGGEQLYQDVSNKRVRYVVIAQKVYLVRTLSLELQRKIHDHITGFVLVLYGFTGQQEDKSDACTVTLKPFLGELSASESWTAASIVGSGLDLETYPVHIIAYTL